MNTARPEGTVARQAHLLDCAIAVVGESGLRGLTHRAVDRAAGLPEGSCSVYYRTRLALLTALTDHVAEKLLGDVRMLTAGLPTDTADPSAAVAGTTGLLVGLARDPALLLTLSELSLEAVRTPSLQEPMRVWRRALVDVVRTLVEAHHKGDSLRRARTMVAALEGVAIASLNVAEPEREAFLADTIGMLLQAMTDLETA
ncbi:TetR/AcrR family transcriptional regulator [Calidifontibacter indicus]|uniref:TetR family transcriptional regulator n=1 Tax=Calidifontibacter indicus TaxID=419650 RepID=A0A3D9UM69_9MICO|nr:TetR/AcrR family transcriptional regulator [Calidifontibacter indicus]REF30419.1 TetR family transcriptional regulator [Calidifontibacter indicus]